jgi:CubicO group peptidase (beta-lactamase class C family)
MVKFVSMRFFLLSFLSIWLVCACKKDATPPGPGVDAPLYFPPNGSADWEAISPSLLGWNMGELNNTINYLQEKNTKAFIILYNGRVVVERYFGSFTKDSVWYWASAGKTLTASLVSMAQHEGLLKITDPTSKYLGNGWTSLTQEQEAAITIRHQLTMTSGLDDDVPDDDCTLPSCLKFKSSPGSRWAYHNAPYTLLEKVVENASGKAYNQFFREKIGTPIGMNGVWLRNGLYNNVFFSNGRSMARFGLLLMANGNWNGRDVISDKLFLQDMTNSSQNLNLSYGYLTWLNGKVSHMLPIVRVVFSGSLVPNAPADMYAALGKNDQKIYVVPSKKLVIIRMGESAGNVQLAVSSFDNELWGYLKRVF